VMHLVTTDQDLLARLCQLLDGQPAGVIMRAIANGQAVPYADMMRALLDAMRSVEGDDRLRIVACASAATRTRFDAEGRVRKMDRDERMAVAPWSPILRSMGILDPRYIPPLPSPD